ncbi:hypothetical protein EsVE80_14670 [Enterococcus saigonensis]|uniref:SpaA-like prealbumin fold domain-containing protein n=1 Tax=Enterococcus saigonensis TaxID=1805431 RepID=A0A679IPX2_9ENTE|nr:SpaA isopeptide-forming pilin-related protein [Enterococcus saigonensis]BCA85944.1 hypothetical protein EsVE80_14670 [Enterococcus saigonensis]
MNKRKKAIVVIAVFAILLPMLEGLFSISSLWKTSASEPTPTALIDTDFLKVSYTVQNDTEKGVTSWLVHYDYDMVKAPNTINDAYEKGKLKIKLINGDIVSAADSNLQLPENQFQAGSVEKGSWIEEKSFATDGKGSFKYTAAIGSEPKLALQFDGENPVVIDSISTVATSAETSEEETVPSATEEFEIVENILVGKLADTYTLKGPAVENSAEKPQNQEKNIDNTKEAGQLRNTRALSATTVGKDLIISQDAIVDKVYVISKSSQEGKDEYKPTIKHKNNNTAAHSGDYNSAELALGDNTYKLFTDGAAGTTIAYNKPKNGTNPYYAAINASNSKDKTTTMQFNDGKTMKNEEITLIYDHVGGYIGADGVTPKKVGAVVHLTNIIIGPSATWNSKDLNPWMEFSHNLFSGVIYGNIHKFDIEFNFFDAEKYPNASDKKIPGDFINFSDDSAATMTFASLNGYDNIALHSNVTATKAHEFAGRIDGGEAGAVGSTLEFKSNGSCAYDKNTYYSKDGTNTFTDYLGGATFATAAVTFPMTGVSHKYKFGSTQGRAWNTFASSSLAQVNQNPPTKTVQPLKQYQKGDSWDNPTGAESGFNQRYYNDLDRYNDGNDPWSLPEKYRVKGHDADKGDLADGVPEKASRFVKTDQEHYYFINQETIDVSSKSLIVPKQYIIEDTLPSGVKLSNDTWKNSIVLYNLDGSTINSPFTNASSYDSATGVLKLTLSETASRKINEQSGKDGYYGKDFSLRLKVKVTNTVDDKINDLMENKAKVTFVYGTTTEQKPVFESNLVHTKVRDKKTTIEFEKIDGQGNPLSGVGFTLYESGEKTSLASATSGNNGKVTFNHPVAPGNYVIKETQTPEGYEPIDDLKVTVDQNLNVTIKDSANNPITDNKVENHLYPFRLELQKIDGFGSALKGATFTLTKDSETYTATSNPEGKITFTEDLKPGTYTLTETNTPAGYTSAGSWTIVISEDKTATLDDKALTVAYDATAQRWMISPNEKTGKIVNQIKPFELSILKVADYTDAKLANATFELFEKTDVAFDNPLAEATTGNDGKAIFKDSNKEVYKLEAGKSYWVKEKDAPDGYILLEHPFELAVGENGEVTVKYNQSNVAVSDIHVNLTSDSANNTIQLTAKNTPEGSLPTTGGQGIKKFMTLSIAVLAIVGGLGAFYVYRNKKGGA